MWYILMAQQVEYPSWHSLLPYQPLAQDLIEVKTQFSTPHWTRQPHIVVQLMKILWGEKIEFVLTWKNLMCDRKDFNETDFSPYATILMHTWLAQK